MSSPDDAIAAEAASDAEIQAMLAKAVRFMPNARRKQTAAWPAFPADATITATDVMVTVSAMLKAVNLQVFELGMWQAWSGR